MTLSPATTRCLDALDRGCPERRDCARWVYRNKRPIGGHGSSFAAQRGKNGCAHIIRLETSNAKAV